MPKITVRYYYIKYTQIFQTINFLRRETEDTNASLCVRT